MPTARHTLFCERLLRWSAKRQVPHAIVMPGREIPYAELGARVMRCAAWLVAEGCRPGCAVGITIADEVDHLTVCFALLVLGVPQVCLPTTDPPAVRRRLAERLSVARIVVSDPALGLSGYATSRFEAGASGGNPVGVDGMALDADPDVEAMYFTSSGTTGEPKIIPLSQRMIATRQLHRNFEAGERLMLLTSVEDFPGKSARLGCAYRGLTSVLMPGSTARTIEIGAACARHRVTRLIIGVLHLTSFVQGDVDTLPVGLKVFVGGSRVPQRLRDSFRARARARLHVEYGARESGGCTTTFPVDRDEAVETVGLAAPAAELEIVDAEGRPVASGVVGEIRVRTPGMAAGYFQDPSSTARHFRDGWFHPGDLGSFTANGSLCLSGRTDDVINLNGIKIYPAEIERVLEDDPRVRSAAAFALPSEVHGEIPVVAVEWAGEGKPDAAALMERARARLGVRAPRKVLLVEALPRNSAGKVVKSALVRLAIERD